MPLAWLAEAQYGVAEQGPTHTQWKHGGRMQEVTMARGLNRLLSSLLYAPIPLKSGHTVL